MDIGHITGSGGVNRPGSHSERIASDAAARGKTDRSSKSTDSAAISETGRSTLEAVDAFTERARAGEDRTEIVAQAKARLESGALSSTEAFEGAARGLLRGGF